MARPHLQGGKAPYRPPLVSTRRETGSPAMLGPGLGYGAPHQGSANANALLLRLAGDNAPGRTV
jgi:hypothetical protein